MSMLMHNVMLGIVVVALWTCGLWQLLFGEEGRAFPLAPQLAPWWKHQGVGLLWILAGCVLAWILLRRLGF